MIRDGFVIRTDDDFIRAHMTAIEPRAKRKSSEVRDSSSGSLGSPSSRQELGHGKARRRPVADRPLSVPLARSGCSPTHEPACTLARNKR